MVVCLSNIKSFLFQWVCTSMLRYLSMLYLSNFYYSHVWTSKTGGNLFWFDVKNTKKSEKNYKMQMSDNSHSVIIYTLIKLEGRDFFLVLFIVFICLQAKHTSLIAFFKTPFHNCSLECTWTFSPLDNGTPMRKFPEYSHNHK